MDPLNPLKPKPIRGIPLGGIGGGGIAVGLLVPSLQKCTTEGKEGSPS